MNGKLKSFLKFAVCAPAFSQRNVTSIGLVLLFVLVYILAGGKVTTSLPRPPSANSPFGMPSESKNLTRKESKSVIGEIASEDKSQREAQRAKMGSLFTEEEVEEAETKEAVNPEGLVKGADFVSRREKRLLERTEKKESDSLSVIEERLRSTRNGQFITD